MKLRSPMLARSLRKEVLHQASHFWACERVGQIAQHQGSVLQWWRQRRAHDAEDHGRHAADDLALRHDSVASAWVYLEPRTSAGPVCSTRLRCSVHTFAGLL